MPSSSDITINPDGSKTVTITKLRERLLMDGRPNYQIGGLCGIHHSRLSLYVQGKAGITPKHLHALCKVLDCQPDDILGSSSYTVQP
jgi:hypothetical protein